MNFRKIISFVFICVLTANLHAALSDGELLKSPNGKITVKLQEKNAQLQYSVALNDKAIIKPSLLGLKANSDAKLSLGDIKRSSGDKTWKPVWGIHSQINDKYNELAVKVNGESAQTIKFRVYDDGIAFRYELPQGQAFSNPNYVYEASEVNLISQSPKAWFPLSVVLVSDTTDLDNWKEKGSSDTATKGNSSKKKKGKGKKKKPQDTGGDPNKNSRYDFKPERIRTPFTVKLADSAYISVHEAAVVESDMARVKLTGHNLRYLSNIKGSGGQVTPWRTVTIGDRPGALIESTLIYNLNKPSTVKDTSWIKPGVTMWDWRVHGAKTKDGFVYGINTQSYLRYIDFASEAGVDYLLIDAEWYGPEHSKKSDPKTAIRAVDIEKVCSYGKKKGVGIWLYINTEALKHFDMDATFAQYKKWGVVGIKQGFLAGPDRKNVEFDLKVVKKCAEHKLMYTRHETPKPTGYDRTYPNVMGYEFVNSMLDGPARPSATPSRVISGLFVFGLTGPVDRSCGLFDLDTYIARDKCHRQIPSTVVSQTAQCLIYPSGLLTLPDMPEAYQRKADLFEFISELPMNWDETKVLSSEITKHITLARRAGNNWFVGSLADEDGHKAQVKLDFLKEGVTYKLTLYEDAPNAHYEYVGPMNKKLAQAQKTKLKPTKTRRELYQVKKLTVKKGDTIPVVMAPGGGHCMWLRPASK